MKSLIIFSMWLTYLALSFALVGRLMNQNSENSVTIALIGAIAAETVTGLLYYLKTEPSKENRRIYRLSNGSELDNGLSAFILSTIINLSKDRDVTAAEVCNYVESHTPKGVSTISIIQGLRTKGYISMTPDATSPTSIVKAK